MDFEARSAEDLVYGLLESSPSSSTSSGGGFLAHPAASSSSSAGLRIELRAASASGHSCTSHFSNGKSLAPILPEDGVVVSTGDPLRFDARRTSNSVADGWGDARSTNWLLGGDPDLDAAVGGTNPAGATREATRDACRLEFEFRCVADEGSGEGRRAAYVGLEYVFASEEYYEHLGTPYGDVFAVSLNGENAASLPSGAAVGIDTVNPTTNGEYFVGNDATGDEGAIYPSVEADGLTAPLAARGEVTVGEWNAMKIAIADVGDGMLDSWLLLRDGSLRCEATEQVQAPIPRESNVQESAVEPLAMRPPRDVPPRPPSDIVDLAHSSGVESLGGIGADVMNSGTLSPSSAPQAGAISLATEGPTVTGAPSDAPTEMPCTCDQSENRKDDLIVGIQSHLTPCSPLLIPFPTLHWRLLRHNDDTTVEFEPKSASDLLTSVLLSPSNAASGFVHFQNIAASDHACFAYFLEGHRMGSHLVSGDHLMSDSGLIMSSGDPADFCGNDSDQNTKNWFLDGDADLTAVAQEINPFSVTYDACSIEFEFRCGDGTTPLNDPRVSFDYVFGSEEYYEYVNSDFNDAFAFFLNGENIALLPDGITEVTINTVNYDRHEEYFVGNDVSEASGVQYPRVEADGFTTKLTASGVPNDGWNAVKLVIADVADRILDSWVLIEEGTFFCRETGTESPTVPATAAPSRAPTAQPTSGPSRAPSLSPVVTIPGPTECTDGVELSVIVVPDGYPSETSWTLVNTCTGQAQESVDKTALYTAAGTTYTSDYCVPHAAYTFTIYDEYGDGICCGYGSGSYFVTYDGAQVASGGAFASSESTSFGTCSSPSASPTSPVNPEYDCTSFSDDGTTMGYSVIIEENTNSAAKNVYKKMFVGGNLRNPSQSSITVGGHVYYGSMTLPINTNFNGGKTQLSDAGAPPLDFEYYKWLAMHIKAGSYGNGYEVIVETQPKGSCYDMYDFLGPAAQGSNNGKTLVVFNFSDNVCLTKTSDGRQFGPSVLAPFSKVTLTNAGYLDGIVIARRFTTVKNGNIGSEQQLHGVVYAGPVECVSGAPTASPNEVVAILSESPSKAPTSAPSRTPSLSPVAANQTPAPTPCTDGVGIMVIVVTDSYPSETSWTLVNSCTGQTHASVAKNTLYAAPGTTYTSDYCVPPAAYTFTIFDSYGDGICCGYGSGSYFVTYDGAQVASGGQFAGSDSISFGTCVTDAPTSSPSSSPTHTPTSSPNALISDGDTPTSSPSASPENQCMSFDDKDPISLVRSVLRDPNGLAQFQNVQASDHACFKYFYNGHVMGQNLVSGQTLLPDEGIIMSSGDPEEFCFNDSDQNSKNFQEEGDPDLTAVVQQSSRHSSSYDACVLEFEFRCENAELVGVPEVSFKYVWGSDEYYEYVNSAFNDVFGFFLNGQNIALLPDGETQVTINNVNHFVNTEYFIGNDVSEPGGIQYPKIEADGFTTHLVAKGHPQEGWNHIKIAVADVADRILDSYVLLEAGSFTCIERTQAPSVSAEPTNYPTATAKPSNIHSDSPSTSPPPTGMPIPATPAPISPTWSPTISEGPTHSLNIDGPEWGPGGPCMYEVYKAYGGPGNLQCTAKEVQMDTTEVEGPDTCEQGTTITVNITANVHFNADRFDLAFYTYTGTENRDPVYGESCAVDILGAEDTHENQDGDNGVYDMDGDVCYDVLAQSGWHLTNYKFQENLVVPCEFGEDSSTQTVHVQTCFSWRTPGNNNKKNENLHCDESAAYPGTPSKCTCTWTDINIPIRLDPSSMPSKSPSPSLYPSFNPSHAGPTPSPTTGEPSPSPSSMPTIEPSVSLQPSYSSVRFTAKPTASPTGVPSLSGAPSLKPSFLFEIQYECTSFADDGTTMDYAVITEEDTDSAAKNVYKKMFVGGNLRNPSQSTITVGGHVYYGSLTLPINTNFNGGKTQLSDGSAPPLNFEYYQWLAMHIIAG
ncbi:hypothetical protein ACHAWF_016052, partial [Thalassiosira exigua]